MKIYTKTGDSGTTGLIGGQRISKSEITAHTIGNLDETNALVGLCLASLRESPFHNELKDMEVVLNSIQGKLFEIGAEVASPIEGKHRYESDLVGSITNLESSIDGMNDVLPPLQQFILPGGSSTASMLHLARTVVRRTERSVVALAKEKSISPNVLSYLNRLSDWMFVAARYINHVEKVEETKWQS